MGKRTLLQLFFAFFCGNILAQPALVCRPENFDFGFSILNSVIVHKTMLKSVGTETVKIKKVETGCSCTTMPLARNEIAPGDSLEVEIRWDTGRTHGPVKRYPRVFYEGAEEPLRLALFTNVVNVPDSNLAVTVLPYRFELGSHPSKSVDSLEFRLKNNTGKDIQVKVTSHQLEKCDIFVPDFIPANGITFGYIKMKPEFLSLEFEDSITFWFSDNPKYFITTPIRRKIYGASEG